MAIKSSTLLWTRLNSLSFLSILLASATLSVVWWWLVGWRDSSKRWCWCSQMMNLTKLCDLCFSFCYFLASFFSMMSEWREEKNWIPEWHLWRGEGRECNSSLEINNKWLRHSSITLVLVKNILLLYDSNWMWSEVGIILVCARERSSAEWEEVYVCMNVCQM